MTLRNCIPLLLLFAFVSCKNSSVTENGTSDTATIDGHPAWIMQGNIYEVNVRQYTKEGTFKAFAAHLDRLKDMGVQTLWFMPIHPIGKVERKGTLGSYYAVADYTAINPEFGNMQDWKDLVQQAHEKGFKVIIDWVPNHTGADHYWLEKHPDFYVKDSTGKPVSQFDWTDTRKLNYANQELRDTMIEQMKFWVTQTGIDGYRCDYAVGPDISFWKDCLQQLKAAKKGLFMLAEADSAWLHDAGFDATYAWPEFHMTKMIAAGKRKASALDSVLGGTGGPLPSNAMRVFFTSNHDENSWNKADYETMPGASHAPFAVLTQTIGRSIPLVYSGQEEPVLRAIPFFEKDSMGFSRYQRAPLYTELQKLRKDNPALAANASFVRIPADNENIYSFYRRSGEHIVFVVLNLSNQPQSTKLSMDTQDVLGTAATYKTMGIGDGKKVIPSSFELKPWEYLVMYK